MNKLRILVPVFGFLALAVLFLKLPETPSLFACKACVSQDPYLPLIGAGYFAALIAASFLFPSFPSLPVARGGLIWAVLLAGTLTYLNLPNLCIDCLIAHACNILIWTIWLIFPFSEPNKRDFPVRERVYLFLFAPISVIALFGALNLTFKVYHFGSQDKVLSYLKVGDRLPFFTVKTASGNSFAREDAHTVQTTVINFISPDCPYCKEQMVILDSVREQVSQKTCRFINVTPFLKTELMQRSSAGIEWVEDKQGELRNLFKISVYPTLFVVGQDGKIVLIIPGVPDQLKTDLLTALANGG